MARDSGFPAANGPRAQATALLARLDTLWRTVQARVSDRLLAVYAALVGAAAGALVADRFVRSMWSHAIFTGEHQWRTVALVLTVIWLAIGAFAALAVLGPPPGEDGPDDVA